MEESITWSPIIKWIIGLAIIGISAYILYEYVFGVILEIPGLDDITKFEKYSTCVLAICSNGVGGKQVDKVGCFDGGITGTNCTATCRRIADEWKDTRKPTFFDINGIPHFCGEENYLEFDLDFSITVRSGQMQKSADPKWVCDASKLAGFIIPFSDEFKNSRGDYRVWHPKT